MSLKVCGHPRGHIASCNGSLKQLETSVKCDLHNSSLSASERAALVQEWTEKERFRKALKLTQFQRDVRSRVSAKGKLMQQEMAETTSKAMRSEQEAAERALKLDNTKVPHSVTMGHDVEDVKITASARESHFSQHQASHDTSPLQMARAALLSQSKNHQIDAKSSKPKAKSATSTTPSHKARKNYHSVTQISPEMCSRRLSMEHLTKDTSGRGKLNRVPISSKSNLRNFTAPGQVEHMEHVQAGKQYLMFRRLYSDLEREKARNKKMQKAHSRRVKALKKKKEAYRRRKEEEEEEANLTESCSIISTSLSEEKQLAAEWAELMVQEERKQGLQKVKETERFMAALRVQLRELVAARKVEVPPLCSCGETVWDTNPKTCANNCIFYRNPKVYVKTMSNLLQSLNL